MPILQTDRRAFLAGSAALSALVALPGRAADPSPPNAQRVATPPTSAGTAAAGRLTFHGIDTYHGSTVGTLKVDIAMQDAGGYLFLKTFNTAGNGRSEGALFEGDTFKPGRYELSMYIGDYYAALGTKLPSPTFISRVPLRFGIAEVRERYHSAVLFGPWSYSYYRGS